jgi:hypothetical protein
MLGSLSKEHYNNVLSIHPIALQPISGLGLLFFSWGSVTIFYSVGLLAPRPTPSLEDQVSVFMTPRRQGGPAIPLGTG